MGMAAGETQWQALPGWLPVSVSRYLAHTETGVSLRELARRTGCHASTILRQVRRYENRRDDPLVDEALATLGQLAVGHPPRTKDMTGMTAQATLAPNLPDSPTIEREARRVLRRLAEQGAVLALTADLEKAAVLRAMPGGQMVQTAVVDRQVAMAFALKEWILCKTSGRVATYEITPAGRVELKRLITLAARPGAGMAEAGARFDAAGGRFQTREVDLEGGGRQRVRYNLSESPVSLLARRREKDGRPFLAPDLVAAAERLREDFELAQMGPRVAQNWERFLTGGDRGGFQPGGPREGGSGAARDRVAAALRDLGPGLGDVALRVCCFLEGVEATERRMGWAARSGKIVLRIALQRLRRHYDDTYGRAGPLIG